MQDLLITMMNTKDFGKLAWMLLKQRNKRKGCVSQLLKPLKRYNESEDAKMVKQEK